MAKVTIYLSDDLADKVRAAGISMSPVCQRALRRELDTMNTAQSLKESARLQVIDEAGDQVGFMFLEKVE